MSIDEMHFMIQYFYRCTAHSVVYLNTRTNTCTHTHTHTHTQTQTHTHIYIHII